MKENGTEPKSLKKQMRQDVQRVVKELTPDYCREADAAIRDAVRSLPEYRRAGTMFCFVGRVPGEIDTMPLIEQAFAEGKRVGVPKCVSMGVMNVQEIRSADDLEPGAYGIREPKASCPVIPPDEIDFVVMPCLSCSHDGRRLGFGGGFYDRYLENLPAEKAVVVREKVMRDDIPVQAHDVPVGTVVTEKGVIRTGSDGAKGEQERDAGH